jgi:GT2 family glycosyltransferase
MPKKTEREDPSKSSSRRTPDLTKALGAEDRKPAPARKSKRSPSAEITELRALVEQQSRNIDDLTSRVDSILERQDRVVSGFYDLKLSLATSEKEEGPPADPADDPDATRKVAYFESVRSVREVVRRLLPRDAVLLVASKGHDELLDLHGRRALHFPQMADGTYPGYYPQDGHAVIGQLEALRSRGADYLVFPWSSLWWLESYSNFARHLHLHYPTVVDDPDSCVIFALGERRAADARTWRHQLLDIIEDCAAETGTEPAVLDLNTGLDLESLMPSKAVFCPPAEGPALTYLDKSVDIVVAMSSDDAVLSEGRRVAGHSVVKLEQSTGDVNASSDVLAYTTSIERMNGRLRRTTQSCSIIIPTHDSCEQLGPCLGMLDDTLPPSFEGEVIVVDDGSGEAVRALLDDSDQPSRLNLKVVRNKSNLGFVKSCNRGAAAATGDFLVFLNDDTVPLCGWLPALLRTFRTHPDAGAVGGKLLFPDGRLQEAGSVIFSDGTGANFGRGDLFSDDALYNYVREVDYCSAALLATSRKLFDEIGGFDERYCPAYYEDVDYCFAVRNRGYKVYYQPESVVVHVEGATGGTDLSAGTKRYQVINQVKFEKKWSQELRKQPEPTGSDEPPIWHTLAIRGA